MNVDGARAGGQNRAVLSKEFTEIHGALHFVVTQGDMSIDATHVLELRVAGNLAVSLCSCVFFGAFDERSPDATSPHLGLDVPTLDERTSDERQPGAYLR